MAPDHPGKWVPHRNPDTADSAASVLDSELSGVAWMTSVEEAIWGNFGIPVMVTVVETRLLRENTTGVTEASIYFEDDPMTGITTPNAKKKVAAELPRGQLQHQEWPGFIQATIK